MRIWQRLSLLSLVTLLNSVSYGEAANDPLTGPFEQDTYRFASTYASHRGTTPEACSQLCAGDNICQAWTLTPPLFTGGPRCELKRSMGRTENRPGAVSGLSPRVLNTPQSVPASAAPADVTPADVAPAGPELMGGPPAPAAAPQPEARPAAIPTFPAPAPSPRLQAQTPPEMIRRPATPPPAVSVPAAAPAPQAEAPSGEITASAPPPLIARPAPAPMPTPQPVAATPPPPRPAAPLAPPEDGLRPLPSRRDLPPLPRPALRSYSVQRPEEIVGDRESTAGFVNGVPDDAAVVPLADPESYDDETLFDDIEPGGEDPLEPEAEGFGED